MKNSKIKINKNILIAVFLLAVIFCLCFMLVTTGDTHLAWNCMYYDALWDLREPFTESTSLYAFGYIEYIENALLDPDEFKLREGEALLGWPEAEFFTSRVRLVVPDAGYYSFYRGSVDFAHRLYANGHFLTQWGTPGRTKETNIPNTGQISVTIKADPFYDPQTGTWAGIIELVQQSSNFVHRYGGGHVHWYISNQDLRTFLVLDFNESIKIGIFLGLFFIHIVLFVLLPNYKGNLYFALFCFMWLFRTGVTGPKIFSDLMPWLSWFVKFRIEYLAIPVTAVLLIALLHVLFPKILHKIFRYCLNTVSAVFIVVFMFADTIFMSHALQWYYPVLIITILYIVGSFIYRFVTGLKQKSPEPLKGEHKVFLTGLSIFFFATLYDISYYSNIVNLVNFPINILHPQDATSVSMLYLSFCWAAAMFIVTTREMKQAAAENAVLQEKIRMASDNIKTILEEQGLSKQEIEVAMLFMKDGLSYKEIGNRLYISANTAKTHCINIYSKFNVNSRGELMAKFIGM